MKPRMPCGAWLPYRQRSSLSAITLAALTFALRMPFWSRPLDMDEGLYAYGGWQLLKGLVIYRDLWDFKPPGVYFLNALIFSLSSPNAVNIYVCAAFFGSVTCLGVYKIAERLWGRGAALLSGLFFALFSASPYVQGCGLNTEVFMVAPLTWGLYSVLRALEDGKRRWYVVSGLLIGCATLFKQVAGVGVCLAALAVYYNVRQQEITLRHAFLSLCIFLGSSLLPWFAFAGYFACHEALADFLFWVVRYPSRHASYVFSDLSRKQWSHIRWVLQGTLIFWLFTLVALPMALRRASTSSEKVLAVLFLLSALAITAGWGFYPHYFTQAVPVMALLSARGLTWVRDAARKRGAKAGTLFLVALLLSLSFLYVKAHYKFYLVYTGDQISLEEYRWATGEIHESIFGIARSVGVDLRRDTLENETILVWKYHPEINFYALRRTPVRAPIVALVSPPNPFTEIIRDIDHDKPDYVVLFQVLSAYQFEQLDSILKREYVQVYRINGLNFAEQGVYKKRPND